jgi:hypothetical protein
MDIGDPDILPWLDNAVEPIAQGLWMVLKYWPLLTLVGVLKEDG